MTDAELLDCCSAILEAHGARPVPRADARFRFTVLGTTRRCAGCGHGSQEHGATGECWHLADFAGPDCTCGQPTEAAA